jgi:hypothetical protein
VIFVTRETHETPADVALVLRLAGGLNRYGEPNYRAVWGGNRLDFVGGKWEDHDKDGNLVREVIEVRRVPKYPQNRWHVERWMPPETYGGPALWALQTMEAVDGQFVPALGPYPSRGDYELAFTLETSTGAFVQLTPMIARAFVACLETSREETPESVTEFKSKAIAKQEREYDSYADSVLNTGSTISGPQVSVL